MSANPGFPMAITITQTKQSKLPRKTKELPMLDMEIEVVVENTF